MSSIGFFRHLRIFQFPEEMEKVTSGREGDCVPLHVRLGPTEVCNHRCSFCFTQDPKRIRTMGALRIDGRTSMERERLLRLVDELADVGVLAISFTGVGDPLMYPKIFDVLSRTVERGIKFSITSNMAMPMNDKLIEVLSHATWLRLSMNAGSATTYALVHAPTARNKDKVYATMLDNVRRFDRVRRQRSTRHEFNISYVISFNNDHEVLSAAKLAKSMGADSISFRTDTIFAFRPDAIFDQQENHDAHFEKVLTLIKAAKEELNDEQFQVFDNREWQQEVRAVSDDQLCFYSNHSCYIDAKGDVYPCCITRSDGRYVIGNINDKSFSDFWHSEGRRQHYKKLQENTCLPCAFSYLNTALKPLYQRKANVFEVCDKGRDVTKNPFI